MRKACRICHVMAGVDENGRCPSCADVYMASLSNMTYGKYIAQRAVEAATAAQHGANERKCAHCGGWYLARADIEAAPTVDAVQVVFCRDCKYYAPEDWDGCTCHAYGGMTDPDDSSFCSYGERREDHDGKP